MEKTEQGSSSREEEDLERQSLTGKENNKEERKENSCSKKKIAGLALLSIAAITCLYVGGNYLLSESAAESTASTVPRTPQKTPFLEVEVKMEEVAPPDFREFGNQVIGKWKLLNSTEPIPYYVALGMDKFMANIVTKLDSVMTIELTSEGFVQTSTVTGLAGAFLPASMKTHVVKPIFGGKVENVYNGISKDEEDWFATAFPDRWEIFITHHDVKNENQESMTEHMTMRISTVMDEKSKKEVRQLSIHRLLNDAPSTECTWFLRPTK